MARIRVVKLGGKRYKKNGGRKTVYFHDDNFDNATKVKNTRDKIVIINNKQEDKYFRNKVALYGDKIRFHS